MQNLAERQSAIGGYLELELGTRGRELYPDAIALQSARAAFLALLLAGKPKCIWIPWYICDTMVDQAAMAGVQVLRYGINECFSISEDVELNRNDWLLYVNYFGLCGTEVEKVLSRFPSGQVIIDNSHALFAEPRECLATIYSPRKFVGVPDGSYLITDINVDRPVDEDRGSLTRCQPLLIRIAECAEQGYANFLESQGGLAGQMPMRMSQLTHRILQSVDYPKVIASRTANFDTLDAALSAKNQFLLRRTNGDVPLSYPFVGGSSLLRQTLISRRVYVPQYWPNLNEDANIPEFEKFLAENCIPLPCDQRYGQHEMDYVSDLVNKDLQSIAVLTGENPL